MSETKIIELETKLAFLEKHFEELNQAITDQQFALQKIQAQIKALSEQLKNFNNLNNEPNQKPPHY